MGFSSNAVLAKARSMYSHRMTPAKYEELIHKGSVAEIVSFLKNEPSYQDVLEEIKETNVHRGRIESLLNEQAFIETTKMLRYVPKKKQEFYKLSVIKEEIHLIIDKVRLIDSEVNDSYDLNIPSYLAQCASFDLYGLIAIDDYATLCQYMKRTPFYKVLKKNIPEDGEKVDINIMEYDFKKAYYDHVVGVIKKEFKGKKQKDLLTIVYTEIELENISKIYRLKKYFNVTEEQIRGCLITDYCRLSDSMMDMLIKAKDAEDMLKKLSSSSYKLYVDEKDFVYIEYYAEKIKYHLAKRYMRFSTDPSLVYMTYAIVHRIEINNLIHIIEGIRYGESAEHIKAMLIY